MIPTVIFTTLFVGLVVAVIVGLMAPNTPAIWLTAAIVVGLATGGLMYGRIHARLARTYGDRQRLTVSPYGLIRTDGTIRTDMPWAGMNRIEVRNSALPGRRANVRQAGAAGVGANAVLDVARTKIAAGIVGRATISPLPGANRAQLKVHDRLSGGRSNLRGGGSHLAEQGLIFPGEFEENWAQGVVGAYLRHYRPDIRFPA
ncbi:hypothetical protein [Gordonia sp. (in: high G+C Gram-positive bacteria)]|uniref:hypothetical protein n=1 Tax=unclassified Gordonia (in: high G+C Gram-positive bacteria) TaxID=2657482 RepID=UPI0035270DA1